MTLNITIRVNNDPPIGVVEVRRLASNAAALIEAEGFAEYSVTTHQRRDADSPMQPVHVTTIEHRPTRGALALAEAALTASRFDTAQYGGAR